MKPANLLRVAVAAGLSLGMLSEAQALTAAASFTPANTTVSNTASVDYKVGTVVQTTVPSNTHTFVVDRKVNVTVTANNTPLSVAPGATGNVLAFTVTNESNATLDFAVSGTQSASTTVLSPAAYADSFDMNNFQFFVDSNGNGTYEAGTDTATSITGLAAGDSRVVFAIAKTPDTPVNGSYAGVQVLVTAKELGGGAITATAGADTAGTMDTVFADGAGPLAADASRDGKISVYGAYKVATAAIAVNKSAKVISDPVNNTTNPKAIPGAVIEYCLVIKNSGDAAAADIVLTDAIPAETSFVTGSIRTGATGTDTSCDSGTGTGQSDAADTDDGEKTGAGKGSVTVRTTSVGTPNGVFRALFRVTVD